MSILQGRNVSAHYVQVAILSTKTLARGRRISKQEEERRDGTLACSLIDRVLLEMARRGANARSILQELSIGQASASYD